MAHIILGPSPRSIRRSGASTTLVALALLATACGGGSSPPPPPPPSLTLNPASLTFENPVVGGEYSQTFAIENGGPGTLKVTSVAPNTAAATGGFSVTAPAVPFDVSPDTSATVTVTYAPKSNEAASGSIEVVSNDPTTPNAQVALSSTSNNEAALEICVLEGDTVGAGCTVAGDGSPLADLGVIPRGEDANRVIALYNSGGGSVSVEISSITLDPPSASAYRIELFTLDGTTEVPVTTPAFLAPVGATVGTSELRARVVYTAPGTDGDVTGESVKIVAANVTPATTLVPITGTVSGCPSGKADCDGNAANACEVSIATELNNCGGCGAVCGGTNAAPACVDGACTLNCNNGFGDCDGSLANGCETPTATNINNCGACGTVCGSANGNPVCSNGSCQITCNTGYGNCDANTANGCETNLNTTVAHCSACGAPCPTRANATSTCTGGTCGFTCNTGYANCDNDWLNGCEVNLNTDPAHCGSCSTACSSSHMATVTCGSGVCNGTCSSGYGDCNGNKATDGCEVDLTSSVANCGLCGRVCGNANGTASCVGSLCQITCNTGFANCNGNSSDGCEVNTQTDPNNCNACGTVCSSSGIASRTCGSGTCNGTCSSGYGDCNGNKQGDGCEVNLTNSASNCGSCGNNCTSPTRPNVTSASCVSSACDVTTCTTGYYDMNNVFSDGCECQADANSDFCSTATTGSIALDGTASYYGNITPSSDYDWFALAFAGAGSCSYGPKIVLNDTSGLLRFSVYTSCSYGTIDCAEGGFSGGSYTSYELRPTFSGYCTNSWSTTLYVRVFSTGSATSCLPYSLTVTN